MIKINSKSDPRISQTFPNDPFSNLCIVTTTQKLYLQQAFLSMDSIFFAQIRPETRQINLRELKQQPLIRVIHSLYGQTLQVSSIVQLSQIYPIILYLGIDDYCLNIEEEVRNKKEVLENIQFLEFSYKYRFLFPEVLEIHLENKLRLLEDSKNYLQLSKIEDETLNFVLSEFVNRFGEAESKILNNVLENYFNRKNIKPMVYFKSYSLSKLQTVWLKYHHVSAFELSTPKSTPNIFTFNEEQLKVTAKKSEPAPTRPNEQNESKRQRVAELQKQILSKDAQIVELMKKINGLKDELGIKPELLTKPITARSLLIDVDIDETGMRKQKRFDFSPEFETDNNRPITEENYSSHIEIIKKMGNSEIGQKKMNRFGLGPKSFKRL